MDIAYIYTWRRVSGLTALWVLGSHNGPDPWVFLGFHKDQTHGRKTFKRPLRSVIFFQKAPMQLFFNICKYEMEDEPMPLLEPEIIAPTTSVTPSISSKTPTTVTTNITPIVPVPSQDFKTDVTTPISSPSSFSQPRVPETIGATAVETAKKPSPNSDAKKDVTSVSTPAINGATHPALPIETEIPTTKDKEAKSQQPPALRTVIPTVRPRRPSPVASETSMRGKPPLPLDRTSGVDFLGNLKPRSTPVVFNGKVQPIRFTLPAPNCNGKKKAAKTDGDAPKQPSPKKKKLTPSPPEILAAIQKMTGLVTGTSPAVHPSPQPIAKSSIPTTPAPPAVTVAPTMNVISIDTASKTVISPTSSAHSSVGGGSDGTISPFPSPAGAYKPTPAQSACTQPAKLRLKKSLSSVVQELSSNALEACSPSKKLKFENGSGEEHGATLIH